MSTPWYRLLATNPRGDGLFGLGTLQCMAFAPRGNILATGGSLGVVLWDFREGRVLRRLVMPGGSFEELCFSPGGDRIAALGAQGQVNVARFGSAEKFPTLGRYIYSFNGALSLLALDAGGECIATITLDRNDPEEDEDEEDEAGSDERTPLGAINAFALDPEGKVLMIVHGDGSIRQWRLPAEN